MRSFCHRLPSIFLERIQPQDGFTHKLRLSTRLRIMFSWVLASVVTLFLGGSRVDEAAPDASSRSSASKDAYSYESDPFGLESEWHYQGSLDLRRCFRLG